MKKQIYPPMHSAEHILNQTMVRLFGTERCFSAHIERKKSKCDYHFHRDLQKHEIEEIERKVNEIIDEDLPIEEEYISLDEAKERFDLRRLPDPAPDMIRIVKIGDYDECPCIGPHVKSTKEIGRFRIVSVSFKEGVLRIRYRLNSPQKEYL